MSSFTAAVGPQPAATASHTYTAAGTYTVKVTVTDAAGLAGTKTAQVVVQTNFVRNYGFETDLSGWNTSGGGTGITLERVAVGHSGDWAAKLTNTSASASSALLNDSPNWVIATSASTYAGTLWARADTAGATLNLRFREYSGSTLVGSATTQVKLTTTWQKVTVAYATGAAGASTLDFNAYVVSAAAGTGFYADDAAIYIP